MGYNIKCLKTIKIDTVKVLLIIEITNYYYIFTHFLSKKMNKK